MQFIEWGKPLFRADSIYYRLFNIGRQIALYAATDLWGAFQPTKYLLQKFKIYNIEVNNEFEYILQLQLVKMSICIWI